MNEADEMKLPSGWTLTPVGDLLKFKNGLNKGKAYFGYGTPIVNYMDVFRHAGLRRADVQGLVDVTYAEKQAFSARKGDILFTRTSETPDEVGISTVLLEEIEDSVFSGFVLRGRPVNDRLTPEFAQYCFDSRFVRGQIVSSATYTTRALTNGRILSGVKLPLPDAPNEQQAIAAALSDADEVVAGLERVIAKKRLIKQGAMQDLLTARRRLPGFSGEWEVSSLGSVLRRSPSYGINAPAIPRGTGGFAYLRITDISDDGTVDPSGLPSVREGASDQYLLAEGDIVVARTGASVGKSHLFRDIGEPVIFAGFLIRLCPDETKLLPSFLSQFMQTQNYWDWVRENSARSGQPGVNGQQLRTILLKIPEIEEQQAIAAILSDMDAEIQTLESRLSKARAVKEGMMQNLLTGRVRLV